MGDFGLTGRDASRCLPAPNSSRTSKPQSNAPPTLARRTTRPATAVGNLASQLIALGAVPDLATFRRHLSADLKQTEYGPRSA